MLHVNAQSVRERLARIPLPMLQWQEELVPFVQWLLNDVQPYNIMEIGTSHGGMAWLLSEIATGKLISLDLPDGSSSGLSYTAAQERNEKIARCRPNFVGILADSHGAFALREVENILAGEKLDLLFVDGDHSYYGVQMDFMLYGPLVTPGKYVAFHDINAWSFAPEVEVPRFWKELQGEKKEFSVGGDWGGIGVLRT